MYASARRLTATGLAALALIGSSALTATAGTVTETGQWGLDRIDQRTGRNGRYDQTLTGAGVTIYVVDTGVEGTHPEFGGRVRSGFSTVDDSDGTGDCSDHGTHVAGIAAGEDHGVARKATVVPVKVLGCGFAGNDKGLIDGIDWMIRHHQAGTPAVANLSIAYPASSSATASQVDAAVERAIADGITVVIAAGNESMSAGDEYPGRVANALTVGATNAQDQMTDFSSYGSSVDLLAPGYNIASATNDGGIGLKSGTSMSAPFVAGAAALVLQAHPTWTPAQVSTFLVSNATTGVIGNVAHDTPNRLLWAGFAATSTPTPTPAPSSSPAAQPQLQSVGGTQIKGTPAVGAKLTGVRPGYIPGASTVTMRWHRVTSTGSSTLVATAPIYAPKAADKGQRLRMCATASRSGYRSRTTCSGLTAIVKPGTLLVSGPTAISGRLRVGNRVTAVRPGYIPGASTVTMRWYRLSSTGATSQVGTGSTRLLQAADKGKRLSLCVTATRVGFTNRTTCSAWGTVS